MWPPTSGLLLLIGTEVKITDGPRLVLLATDRDAYGDLSALITEGRRRAAGHALYPNGERHLRDRETLARLYPERLLSETIEIARRCRFSLDELRYEYPEELVPAGETPASHLRSLTHAGMARRWPGGVPAKVRAQVEHELALIAELGYEPYFLTVEDIVRFARTQGILCQGRGSAGNSAVCYCLGITEVDPARIEVLFERFISKERHEPPDIDVDFEHERREAVIPCRVAGAHTETPYRDGTTHIVMSPLEFLQRLAALFPVQGFISFWPDRPPSPAPIRFSP